MEKGCFAKGASFAHRICIVMGADSRQLKVNELRDFAKFKSESLRATSRAVQCRRLWAVAVLMASEISLAGKTKKADIAEAVEEWLNANAGAKDEGKKKTKTK